MKYREPEIYKGPTFPELDKEFNIKEEYYYNNLGNWICRRKSCKFKKRNGRCSCQTILLQKCHFGNYCLTYKKRME